MRVSFLRCSFARLPCPRSVVNRSLPYIELNSGGSAFYLDGAGAPSLRFLYTVQEGESSKDLDVAADFTDVTSTTTIRVPVGGAIYDGLSPFSAAVVALPKPGEAGSLGESTDIIIDTE